MYHYRNTQRKMAVIAGLSLFLMALLAGFAYGYAFQQVKMQPSAGTTFWLRCCITGFILVLLLDVLVAWALYFFMRPAGRHLSLLSSWLRLAYAALLGAALFHLAPLLEMNEHGNSGPFPETSSFYLELFEEAWTMGLIVFSCHLAVLGSLIIKAGYLPKMLGFLALIAAVCYGANSLLLLLWPGYQYYKEHADLLLSGPMAAGELALAIWLVVRGGKRKQIQRSATYPS